MNKNFLLYSVAAVVTAGVLSVPVYKLFTQADAKTPSQKIVGKKSVVEAPKAVLSIPSIQPATTRVIPTGIVPSIVTPVQNSMPILKITPSKIVHKEVVSVVEKIKVTKVIIEGNTILNNKILEAKTNSLLGTFATIEDLKKMALDMTSLYIKAGYGLDRFIVPEQNFEGGIVTFKAIETKYGKVTIKNSSQVKNSVVESTLSTIAGSSVDTKKLNHNLFLLSDIPGLKPSASLSPGAVPGTSDLLVELPEQPRFDATAGFNNYGVAYLGAFQFQGSASINNLFHFGDLFSVTATSAGQGFDYVNINFSTPVGGYGTKVGMGYAAMNYKMGLGFQPFSFMNSGNVAAYDALGSSGYGQTATFWASQPIIRTENTNIATTLSYAHSAFSDTYAQGVGNTRTLDVFSAGLSGYTKESGFLSSATDSFSLAYAPYLLSTNASAFAINPMLATTPGFRSIWTGALGRIQNLPGIGNTFSLQANGQIASGILDPMQQFVLGGQSSVQAYSEAALFGSEGFLSSATFAHVQESNFGIFTSSAFYDFGGIGGAGSPLLTIQGPGVSEAWTKGHWSANLDIATPVGGTPGIIGSTPGIQLWAGISAHY